MRLPASSVAVLNVAAVALASAIPKDALPFEAVKREINTTVVNNNLRVDLGYEVYEGVFNATTGINAWKG